MLSEMMIGFSSKSYLTAEAADAWLDTVVAGLGETDQRGEGVFFCSPFPLVTDALRALEPLGARVGTQDVSAFPVGAYTGEVSAELLSGLGSSFVMVGHPERAKYLGETAETFALKARMAASAGLVPILIVGEPEHGRDPEEVIRPQLDAVFSALESSAPVVVAYEPTWAIGAEQPAPPSHVIEVVGRIREMLSERDGVSRILYGGSAGPGTFSALAEYGAQTGKTEGVPDGVFLGRAGVDPLGFLETVAEVRAAAR